MSLESSHCKMEKTNPEIESTYVGVDVSKAQLDYTTDGARCEQADNDSEGHQRVISQLRKLPGRVVVVCESTGAYHQAFVGALVEAKIEVCVVMPARVRAYAQSQGILAKTDKIDARVLHLYGQASKLRLYQPMDPARVVLRELLEYRRQISDQKVAVSNRVSVAGPVLRQRLERQLQFLKEELSATDRAIEEHIENDPDLGQKAKRMRELKGVGPVLAATLLAYLPEISTMTPNQLSTMVGVSPHPNESGKIKKPRHVRGGRRVVRNVLYMAAVAATTKNPILNAYYHRLRNRGKPGPVAIIAVMRKMLHVIHRLMTNPHFALAG
jgi:transposase